MTRKIKKWSEMLEEIQSRRSRVYREGCKFVYDSGDLPDDSSVSLLAPCLHSSVPTASPPSKCPATPRTGLS